MQILLLVHDDFCEITVRFFDATLSKITCFAKILMPCTTRATLAMRTGTAHRWYHQIVWSKRGDGRSNLYHFAELFMTNNQVISTCWRRTVSKCADFFIRT